MSKRQQDAAEQSERFIRKARELGCDEDPKAFERVFARIVPPKRRPEQAAEEKSGAQRKRRPKRSAE